MPRVGLSSKERISSLKKRYDFFFPKKTLNVNKKPYFLVVLVISYYHPKTEWLKIMFIFLMNLQFTQSLVETNRFSINYIWDSSRLGVGIT